MTNSYSHNIWFVCASCIVVNVIFWLWFLIISLALCLRQQYIPFARNSYIYLHLFMHM
jgi:hypothetical protein